MAKVTYKPGPDDNAQVTWGGKVFEANKAVDVTDPLVLAKAKNNPFFEVQASKDEQQQAEVIGGYADANTGEEVALVRRPRRGGYATPDLGLTAPVPPSAATQGSTAAGPGPSTSPRAPDNFEEIYGAPVAQVATGEYEGAPQYKGPEGTEGAPAKRGPGRPRKGEE